MTARYIRALGLSALLHVLAVAGLMPAASTPATHVEPNKRTPAVVAAAVEDSSFPGLNPVNRARDSSAGEHPPSSLSIGNVRIDVEKIGYRQRVLFPFVSPGLAFELFFPTLPSEDRLIFQRPLTDGRSTRGASRPLVMSEAAMQAVVDKSWSRRDRWKAFEPLQRIVETHGADDDRVATLLRKYRDQNSLQPYADTDIRDTRLWAQLGLAADHVTFIGFIRRYASDHPSTRATTELLFLLDRIAQASRDALAVLLDSDPAEQLAWTRRTNGRAYLLIERIRQDYGAELNRLHLTSNAEIDAYYDAARLTILTGILRTTPHQYGANDARFLIGAIYWREGRANEALRWWRDVTAEDDGSYALACSQVRMALLRGGPDHREVDRILKNEAGRWLMFSYDRLRRFGYRFDTY